MTQEEKQLLLRDLCARLPYGVIINKKVCHSHRLEELIDISYGQKTNEIYVNGYPIKQSKPYLRPMSSMTEEERKELKEISDEYLDKWMSVNDPSVRCELDAKISSKRAEFYNSHYLDWNGIIGNVALEAPSDMYKIE